LAPIPQILFLLFPQFGPPVALCIPGAGTVSCGYGSGGTWRSLPVAIKVGDQAGPVFSKLGFGTHGAGGCKD